MAIKPSDTEIEATYKHALWLRGHMALNPESRMICDLGFEIQRLREQMKEAVKDKERLAWLEEHGMPNVGSAQWQPSSLRAAIDAAREGGK